MYFENFNCKNFELNHFGYEVQNYDFQIGAQIQVMTDKKK